MTEQTSTEGTELSDVKCALLDLFKVFTSVCEENDLRYFVTGGTALGAIRHHGFIPWDDDIDVVMPRPDYERLFNGEVGRKLPGRYEAIVYGPRLYGYFEDLDVRVVKWGGTDSTILHLDVFPVDGTPNFAIARLIHYVHCYTIFVIIKLKRIELIQRFERQKNRSSRPKAEQLLIRFGGLLGRVVEPLDIDWLVNRFNKVTARYPYDTSNVVGMFSGRYRHKDFFPRGVYEPGRVVDFEDMKIFVYNKVEQYLLRVYGEDYMELPPEGKRETHGNQGVVYSPSSMM